MNSKRFLYIRENKSLKVSCNVLGLEDFLTLRCWILLWQSLRLVLGIVLKRLIMLISLHPGLDQYPTPLMLSLQHIISMYVERFLCLLFSKTRRVSCKKQDLLTLPEHLRSPQFFRVRVSHLFLVFHVQCVFVVVCLTCSQICLCPWISLRLELRFGWLSLTILSFTFWRFFFILDVWHLLFSYQNFVLFVCFYFFRFFVF
jgi:hypothetical protein